MKKRLYRAIGGMLAGIMVTSAVYSPAMAATGRVQTVAVEEEVSDETEVVEDNTVSSAAVTSSSSSSDDAKIELAALATPEPGKTYVADFVALAADDATKGQALDGMSLADGTIVAHASVNSKIRTDSHGVTNKPGDSYEIAVSGNAKILFTSCIYGRSTWTLSDANGNTIGTFAGKNTEAAGHDQEKDGAETAQVIKYKGEATVLTLTFDAGAPGETYVHNITVENSALPTGQGENIDIWFDELATDVEGAPDADGNPTVIKTFEQQEIKYGDSSLRLVGNKNAEYEDGLERFTPNNNNKNFMNLERDGKIVNAYKAGNRNATANDITAIPQFGDGTALVFDCVQAGTFVGFVYTGSFVRVWDFDTATGERIPHGANNWLLDTEVGVEYVAFQAEPGHTYVLSTTGKTNNCGFCGVNFALDEEVDIAVEPWSTPGESTYNFDASKFTLEDVFLGTSVASVDKTTNSVELNAGHTYQVKSVDPGVGVKFSANGTDKIKIDENTTSIKLELYEIPDETLTGDIITSDGNASDVTAIKFKNMISGNVTEATINGSSYTVDIKPGDYNTVIEGSLNYTTIDKVKVHSTVDEAGNPLDGAEPNENDIYLKANDPSHIDLPKDIQKDDADKQVQYVSANETAPIKLNNSTSIRASAGDKIVIPVDGFKKITVAGWYAGTWDINGQNSVTTTSSANAANPTTNSYFTNGTESTVTVNITGEGANYLYWIDVVDVAKFDENNTTIQVPSEQFPTLKDANKYINTLLDRPEGEAGRMTIELTDDIEEQIVFDAPYTTVKGNGHTISWYYGVGSFYYSIDGSTGLYNEELFYDKYDSQEGNGSLWGGVAIIRGDNFIAEDTIFKNTYNYEVTAKDAADFEHSAGGLVTEREIGTDVAIYSTKERSNAFYIEAKNIEVYNCKILSSQDTFGRNGSADNGYSVYVKDSVIGGNVDYICGEFTAVFDNCELQWKTYSDGKNNEKIGYITAAKTNPYVFRNCYVTADDDTKAPLGSYGRTWGSGSNVSFIGTETNGYINEASGWGQMSSSDSGAKFYEYNNVNDGNKFPATGVTASTVAAVVPEVLPAELINEYVVGDNIVDKTLGGWVPVHYETMYNFGDANDNETVNAADAALVYQYTLRPESVAGIDMVQADVNGNTVVESADSTHILQKTLNSNYLYPVEKAPSES